jgi:hypothetical protein
MMSSTHTAPDRIDSLIESEYCAAVAATLLARTEFFELLEDAMMPPGRLAEALTAWRAHASQTEVLGGLVGRA